MVRALAITALVAFAAGVALLVSPILAHEAGEAPPARPLGGSPRADAGATAAPWRVSTAALGAPVARWRVPRAADRRPRIQWRDSVAIGLPEDGRLVGGVRLPPQGTHYFTWDPILKREPNRAWRRWGTDDLLRTLLRVIREYAAAHPAAPRVGIGDLSRPHGGDFGPEFGGIGHITHQNGLDADVYYPLRSEAERSPLSVDEVNLRLAQDLVDRFVREGAVVVYVGPNTGLTGPPGIVQAIPNHDNHLHVRIGG
jgi:hypothetical protein